MPFDPTSVDDVSRLRSCIREQRGEFQKYYDNRKVLQDALADPCHKSDEVDTLERRPHNPLDKFLRIVTRGVVSQSPTLRIVRSRQPRVAGMLKSQLEDWGRSVRIDQLLADVFQEALLRWGVCYTGYETTDSGYGMNPFVDVIDFDDYFIDTRGNDEHDIDFEGHCWARRLDHIQRDPTYDPNIVDRLTESAKKRYRNKVTTLYPWVDLQCVYLPEERVELTLTEDRTAIEKPIRVRPYVGPPWGPYPKLNLGKVRGNMVPISRMSMLYDLHEFVARAYRHVYAQADRALEFHAYSGDSEQDAEAHRTALDGEYKKMDNPNGVVTHKKGGVDPQTLAAAIHADNLFDEDAGNLKLMGGLGPSAPTARQEAGLGAGVQAAVDEWRQRVDTFAKRLYETAAWYIRNDPLRQGPVEWTTPNGNTITSEWTPEMALGMDPEDPDMEIIPGSMVNRSAEAQLTFLTTAVDAIAKTMALPGEQPAVFRHSRYRELVAELGNAPEIAELFGEAPNQEAVVPGVEAAAQFGQRQGRPPSAGAAPQQGNKMVERLIFSGGQQQPA